MIVPDIDLITGSVGRLEKLKRLAVSLTRQRGVDFRLIVVEQRDLAATERLLRELSGHLDCRLLESESGLSRARNAGMAIARARILGFPDDDCWYEPDTLRKVLSVFDRNPDCSILIGRQLTAESENVIPAPVRERTVTRSNVWRIAMSSAIFVRSHVVEEVGEFDADLGVGSRHGFISGEETDYVLRGLALGLRGIYDPSVIVRHPAPTETEGRTSVETGFGYGRGMGRVLRQHGYPWTTLSYFTVRPLLGAALAAARGDREIARFRTAVARGRLQGYYARNHGQE